MKLLFVSSYYPPHAKGGAELSTHYLAQALIAAGHTVTVLTAGEQASESTLEGVQVKRLPVSFTAKPLLEERHAKKNARKISDAIKLSEYDLIHAHDFRTALVLSELSHAHKVVTARDYAQICGSTNYLSVDGGPCPGCDWRHVWRNHRVAEAAWPRKAFRAWQYVYNLPYRQAAFAKIKNHLYISHAEQRLIESVQPLSSSAAAVVYNAIGPQYLQTPPISPATRDLLYVGTVERYKGVELLLNAFHELAREFPATQLTIVGDGADKTRFERQAAAWGLQYRIKFIGRLPWDKLITQYDAAKIAVAPHLWVEPFGRTVVEAMARSRLVVASNQGGPSEVIKHQKTGLLFKPGSVESLIEQLRHALTLRDLDYREISDAARTWIEQNLAPVHIAAQHHDFYQTVLRS